MKKDWYTMLLEEENSTPSPAALVPRGPSLARIFSPDDPAPPSSLGGMMARCSPYIPQESLNNYKAGAAMNQWYQQTGGLGNLSEALMPPLRQPPLMISSSSAASTSSGSSVSARSSASQNVRPSEESTMDLGEPSLWQRIHTTEVLVGALVNQVDNMSYPQRGGQGRGRSGMRLMNERPPPTSTGGTLNPSPNNNSGQRPARGRGSSRRNREYEKTGW